MIDATQRRERRIEVLKRRLLKKGSPRIYLSVIVMLTAFAGLATSVTLLHSGVRLMSVRYPISIGVAYFVFLALLALWLWLQRRRFEPDLEILDAVHQASPETQLFDGSVGNVSSFSGVGDFGGAGAGGSWESSTDSVTSMVASSSKWEMPSIDLDLDLDDGWLIVPVIIVLLVGLIASLYVVYIAPVLLAEILVDGVLVAGLYRRVKHIEQRHWLRAAIRQTIVPALVVVLFFTIAGYALQRAVPEAHSIGEVWKHVMK